MIGKAQQQSDTRKMECVIFSRQEQRPLSRGSLPLMMPDVSVAGVDWRYCI